jgi:uncharacterized membrane protein YoaK (UPF0700 family)
MPENTQPVSVHAAIATPPAEGEGVGLLIVGCLAILAGAVDAAGMTLLHDLYVSFMSGNSSSLGAAIARSDWGTARTTGELLALFIAGAAAGQVVVVMAPRLHLPLVLCGAAAVLTVPLLVSVPAALLMTFSMGMLNAALQKVGPMPVSITYVTGSLVKFGQGLGGLLCGRTSDWNWLASLVPWAGLLTGVILSTLGLGRFGNVALQALPALAAVMALLTLPAVLPRRVAGRVRGREQGSSRGEDA